MYNSQIQQHKVCHTIIFTMKHVIVVAEKSGENKELLVIKIADKTAIAKVIKVLSTIDLRSKYSLAISNSDIDTVGNL